MLKFLGRGCAFADENNAAFFTENNELILIDCPAAAFQKVKKMSLENFDKIYILVTHTHGDHIGGIGTMLQFAWFVLNNPVTIAAPSEKVKEDLLIQLTQIEGCEKEWFNIITVNQLHKKWFVSAIATTHAKTLDGKCFGYQLEIDGSKVIYTGDTAVLTPYLKLLKPDSYFYTEAAYYKSDVHIYLKDNLSELVNLAAKGVHVYLMHLDNEEEIIKMIYNTPLKLAPLIDI